MTAKKNRYKFIVTIKTEALGGEQEAHQETIFEQTVQKLDLKKVIAAINPE